MQRNQVVGFGVFLLLLLISEAQGQSQGQEKNSTLEADAELTDLDGGEQAQIGNSPSPSPVAHVSPKSGDPIPPTPKKNLEHEVERNLILYCFLMGFAILLLATAFICFIACFCIPTGCCCCVRKSRLHRAGRVYENSLSNQSSQQAKVFMVEIPASAPRISSKTISVETSGDGSAKSDSEHLHGRRRLHLEEDSGLPESETKQLPYNPQFFDQ